METIITKKYVPLLVIFIILYITPIFFVSPDPALLSRFNLSTLQLKLISLTLVVFLAIIWYSAFYGFAKFKEYAAKITHSPDGRTFNMLANGLGFLALALPVSALASAALDYIAQMYPAFSPTTVVIRRYIMLCLAAIAFIWIYRGSKSLVTLTSKKFKPSLYFWMGVIAVLAMGVLYAYVALANTVGNVPNPISYKAVYYLPPWLIITTYVIPYVFIWLLGVRSIALILFFNKNTQGLVYKKALRHLAVGLSLVVGGSIATQLFMALGNTTGSRGLQLLLIFVYLLLIFMAIGYILIAIGAKKLKKIEEV